MHVRDRERLMGAFLLAVLLHAAIFAAVHFIAPYVPERRPAYLGPLTIVLPDQAMPLTVSRSAEPEAALTPPEPAAQVPAAKPPIPQPPVARTPVPQTATAQAPQRVRQTAARDVSRGEAAAPSPTPSPAGATGGSGAPSAMNYLFPETLPAAPPSPGTVEYPPVRGPDGHAADTSIGGDGRTGSRVVFDDQPAIQDAAVPGAGARRGASAGAAGVQTGSAGSTGLSSQISDLDRTLAARAGSADASGASTGGKESSAPGPVGVSDGESQGVLSPDEFSGQRRIIFQPKPVVPEGTSLEGKPYIEFNVRITITPSGLIAGAVIENPSGYTELDAAVTATMMRWKFEPLPNNVPQENWSAILKISVTAR